MNNSYFLNQEEYGMVKFFMSMTLCILFIVSLLCAGGLGRGENLAVPMTLFVLALDARFIVEWSRFRKSRQAVLFEDRLNFYGASLDLQKIPLECIRDVRSCLSLFAVHRYRSLSEGTAFVKITLTDGGILYTLAKGAGSYFESSPGKNAVEEIKIAVHNKKCDIATANI